MEVTIIEYWDVRAKGILWCGVPAVFEKRFDHQPTDQDIHNTMGDFQSIKLPTVMYGKRVICETRIKSTVAEV